MSNEILAQNLNHSGRRRAGNIFRSRETVTAHPRLENVHKKRRLQTANALTISLAADSIISHPLQRRQVVHESLPLAKEPARRKRVPLQPVVLERGRPHLGAVRGAFVRQGAVEVLTNDVDELAAVGKAFLVTERAHGLVEVDVDDVGEGALRKLHLDVVVDEGGHSGLAVHGN
jgi:hypothetical protein